MSWQAVRQQLGPGHRRNSAPDFSRLASYKAPVLHDAETTLMIRVMLPAAKSDNLLQFKVKPGGALETMQKGIQDAVQGLMTDCREFLDESDLQNNDRNFEIAVASCEGQLEEWQQLLSAAKATENRAESNRVEVAKMKENYLKEIVLLRQQLGVKKRAEERGEEFMVEEVTHLTVADEKPPEESVLAQEAHLQEQAKKDEALHEATLEELRNENQELLYKYKTLKMQMNAQQELMSRRIDLREFAEAEIQTVPPSRCDRFTVTEPTNMVSQEVQVQMQTQTETPASTPAATSARLPFRRRTQLTQPAPPGRRSRMPTMKIEVTDADLPLMDSSSDSSGDEEQDMPATIEVQTAKSEAKVVRVNSDPIASMSLRQITPLPELPGPVGVSIAVQVDPEMLLPGEMSPREPDSPKPGGRRPFVGCTGSQANSEDTIFDPADDLEVDLEVAQIMEPNLPPLTGRERSKSSSKSVSKRAVTLPTEADLSQAPLMTISSQANCVAYVPNNKAISARPSSRNISKPRFARSASRNGAATPVTPRNLTEGSAPSTPRVARTLTQSSVGSYGLF